MMCERDQQVHAHADAAEIKSATSCVYVNVT